MTKEGGGEGIGVDFAKTAIHRAGKSASQLGNKCRFHCREVQEWLDTCEEGQVDMAFTSLGSLAWISELSRYFAGVYRCVKPGGSYVLFDFHPMLHSLNENLVADRGYPFGAEIRRHQSGIVDYIGNSQRCVAPGRLPAGKSRESAFSNSYPVFEFVRSMSEIISAAAQSGWRVEVFEEYASIPWERYLRGLSEIADGYFTFPEGAPRMPLTFSLRLSR